MIEKIRNLFRKKENFKSNKKLSDGITISIIPQINPEIVIGRPGSGKARCFAIPRCECGTKITIVDKNKIEYTGHRYIDGLRAYCKKCDKVLYEIKQDER